MASATVPPSPRLPVPATFRFSRRRIVVSAVSGAVVVMAFVVGFGLWSIHDYGRAPDFPSLVEQPDPSLQGTVASVSHESDGPCLYVTPASGSASTELGCFARESQPSELRWRDDGTLQVTALAESPTRQIVWQRLYDVSDGTAIDVPADSFVDDHPGTTARSQRGRADDSAVSASGETVTATTDVGHVELVVSGPAGTRVLLAADGGEGYAIDTPRWSPDEAWVLVHDSAGRLLVTTVAEPSTTRVLAHQDGDLVAISAADLLVEATS